MHPTESKSHKLVQALSVAEDQLYRVEQGYDAANDMHRAVAANLREQVWDLMHKMQHFYFPGEEPTWDYDANNTYVEVTADDQDWHHLCHSDGTVIFKFHLQNVDGGYIVRDATPQLPFPGMHYVTMEALVIDHVEHVIRNLNAPVA